MSKAMDKLNNVLEKHFVPVAAKIAAQKHIGAIRDGIILTMPFIIVGSIFLILGFIPVPGYNEVMAGIFGDAWLTKLLYPVNVTFGLVGIIGSIGVAYRLAEKYKIDSLSAGVLSLVNFLLVTPFVIPTANGDVTGIPTGSIGSTGLFVAIIVALISTEIYRIVIQKGITIKMPDSVPPAISKSFTAIIPLAFSLTAFWLIRLVVEMTTLESVHNIVGIVLGKPLSILGGSLFGSIIAIIILHLLWVCGVHGGAIVFGVMRPIWLQFTDANRMAYQAGEALPHVFTDAFFDIFIFAGGAGGTLALAVLLVTRARSKQLKEVGKLSLVPGLFNINEPIIFGAPIVLNPIIMIPFILAPVVNTILTYVMMSTGLVAKTAGIVVPWTAPIFVGGFLATGGALSALLMQAINFAVSLAIYYPFFKVFDNQKYQEEVGEAEKVEVTV